MSEARPGDPGDPGESVALYAEFTALPGREDDVATLLARLATEVRREPGNLVFDPHRRVSNPREFFVYEVYRDSAAFRAHLGAAHGAEFNAALSTLIVGDGSVLTRLAPVAV
jgi:quinol monooxygenase YgiN